MIDNQILEDLKSGDPSIRTRAVTRLGRSGDVDAVAILDDVIASDVSDNVREVARNARATLMTTLNGGAATGVPDKNGELPSLEGMVDYIASARRTVFGDDGSDETPEAPLFEADNSWPGALVRLSVYGLLLIAIPASGLIFGYSQLAIFDWTQIDDELARIMAEWLRSVWWVIPTFLVGGWAVMTGLAAMSLGITHGLARAFGGDATFPATINATTPVFIIAQGVTVALFVMQLFMRSLALAQVGSIISGVVFLVAIALAAMLVGAVHRIGWLRGMGVVTIAAFISSTVAGILLTILAIAVGATAVAV
ncbi:MAG: HEAT repeat domain-containing protein [Chloroflexota bacterium]